MRFRTSRLGAAYESFGHNYQRRLGADAHLSEMAPPEKHPSRCWIWSPMQFWRWVGSSRRSFRTGHALGIRDARSWDENVLRGHCSAGGTVDLSMLWFSVSAGAAFFKVGASWPACSSALSDSWSLRRPLGRGGRQLGCHGAASLPRNAYKFAKPISVIT
jgi:hypothetical protein